MVSTLFIEILIIHAFKVKVNQTPIFFSFSMTPIHKILYFIVSSSKFCAETASDDASPNKIIIFASICCGTSLMNSKNSNGPSTDP